MSEATPRRRLVWGASGIAAGLGVNDQTVFNWVRINRYQAIRKSGGKLVADIDALVEEILREGR